MNVYEYFSLDTQILLLRLPQALLVFMACIELFRVSHIIRNPRAMVFVYRLALAFLVFFFARLIASIIDKSMAFEIGYTFNIVSILFWAFIYWKCLRIRIRVTAEDFLPRRGNISKALDDILDEMETTKRQLSKFDDNFTLPTNIK